MSVCLYVCMYVDMYVYVSIWLYVCVSVCLYVCKVCLCVFFQPAHHRLQSEHTSQ